ncbi:MAG: GNAT family N-acetyltransferase [Asgard group archaeon]|nr:GNAT family N-acetyltransferase [Asgard group archaeon]
MSDVIIRPCSLEDYDKIADVFMKSFLTINVGLERRKEITDYYKLIIEKNITNFTVAELNNELIGIGGETRYIGSSIIGYIGVVPSHRRRGYATLIFDRIITESKKFNSTLELFANLGADSLYRKFGFVNEYLTYKCEITTNSNETSHKDVIVNSDIPEWILKMDKDAMGFDRSKLLIFIMKNRNNELVSFKKDGFAFCDGKTIGPIIAKNELVAKKLVNYYLSSGDKSVFIPEYNEIMLKSFSYKKMHTCIKMILGEHHKRETSWLYGFKAFATS